MKKVKISAKKLRIARINKGLKQSELGNIINITGQAISLYEKEDKTVKINTANKICEALDCDLNMIIADEITDENIIEEIEETKNLEKLMKAILELSEESKKIMLGIAEHLKKLESEKGKTQIVGNIENSKEVKIIQK